MSRQSSPLWRMLKNGATDDISIMKPITMSVRRSAPFVCLDRRPQSTVKFCNAEIFLSIEETPLRDLASIVLTLSLPPTEDKPGMAGIATQPAFPLPNLTSVLIHSLIIAVRVRTRVPPKLQTEVEAQPFSPPLELIF